MKMRSNFKIYLAAGSALFDAASAANCNLKPSYAAPVVYNGWQAQLVANGLTAPRGVLFDSSGNLLVVQQGAGIVHLEFDDGGSTCLDVSKKTYLINSTSVSGGEVSRGCLLRLRLAKSWNCALCGWQNTVCVLFRYRFLLGLRCLGRLSRRYESDVNYGHEQ
jgi:hypothetical protein